VHCDLPIAHHWRKEPFAFAAIFGFPVHVFCLRLCPSSFWLGARTHSARTLSRCGACWVCCPSLRWWLSLTSAGRYPEARSFSGSSVCCSGARKGIWIHPGRVFCLDTLLLLCGHSCFSFSIHSSERCPSGSGSFETYRR